MSESLIKNKDVILPDFCLYTDEIDLVDKLVSIYAIIKMDEENQLRDFEKVILVYYMRYGYSAETKKLAEKELGKSYATITQATFYLTKKNYLVASKNNHTKKYLNDDLKRIQAGFLKGDKKIQLIGFKRAVKP